MESTTQRIIDIPRDVMTNEELWQPGGLSCQGCGASLAMKLALKGLGRRTVVVLPACCMAIIVGSYPSSISQVPLLHVPFETAAAAASGVRAALDARGEEDVVVMAWAGDGGTFDIGLQSLSGAAERNDDILYVCYDNEAYMNTGIQRSGATPPGAWTTTTPGEAVKEEPKKDIVRIMLSHGIPYVATASVAYPDDLYAKFRKSRYIKGTKFIHILSPCPPGWQIDPADSVKISRMATQAKIFPIYEVENGTYTINIYPERDVTVQEYMKTQGRFRYMTDDAVNETQKWTDRRWKDLRTMADRI
ncbi:MAG TPA: thiamine pyrophosphate-dependent enzyme [Syntrophales bacterium]|nr:thiamine pyrophosphate-dependent enzyme [Syntrophales bacterium]